MNNLYDECQAAAPPPKKRRRKSPKSSLEAGVIRGCVKYLHDCPAVVYVERRNTGAVRFADGGFVRFGSKGAADIWCLIRTQVYHTRPDEETGDVWMSPEADVDLTHIEIECKRADGKGKQSEAQVQFQQFCNKNNIPYLLVTSATELAEKLSQIRG